MFGGVGSGNILILMVSQVKFGLVEELEDLKGTNAMKVRHLHSQIDGLEEELRVEREEGSKITSVSGREGGRQFGGLKRGMGN